MQILSFKEIKKRIDTILNSKELNFQYFENLIKECIFNLPIPTAVSTHEFLVRCRINNNGEVFNKISQISYNPNPGSIGIQRCNYPNQQVFYGSLFNNTSKSSTLLTAVLETTFEWIKKEDISQIYTTASRWEIKKPFNLITMAFSEQAINKSALMKNAYENYELILDKNKNITKRSLNECKEILFYLTSFFENADNKENSYKVSAAITNYLFKLDSNQSGISYPSASTESAGMNVALRKELVDTSILECSYVQMYKLVKYPNAKIKINGFPCSTPATFVEDGSFILSGIT